MSSKTKIVVLRMKQLIYTGICVAFGLLFVIILLLVFLPKSKGNDNPGTSAENTAYIPGTYTTQLVLGDQTLQLEVIADETGISSIQFLELNDAVTTMYPLLEPTLASISNQFMERGSLEEIEYDDTSRYTSLVLLEALEKTLEKAAPTDQSAK